MGECVNALADVVEEGVLDGAASDRAIEVQGEDEPRHAEMRRHMRITRSPADELV